MSECGVGCDHRTHMSKETEVSTTQAEPKSELFFGKKFKPGTVGYVLENGNRKARRKVMVQLKKMQER